jgi:hypothetical protein
MSPPQPAQPEARSRVLPGQPAAMTQQLQRGSSGTCRRSSGVQKALEVRSAGTAGAFDTMDCAPAQERRLGVLRIYAPSPGPSQWAPASWQQPAGDGGRGGGSAVGGGAGACGRSGAAVTASLLPASPRQRHKAGGARRRPAAAVGAKGHYLQELSRSGHLGIFRRRK